MMTTSSQTHATSDNPSTESDHTILQERRQKLQQWRNGNLAGSIAAYPNDMLPKHQAQVLHQQYDHVDREVLAEQSIHACLAGRMMLKRVMGRASFATLQDATGRLQIYISDKDTGVNRHQAFVGLDLGDIIGVEGTLFKTKTGELSLRCQSVRLLTKCLRPLPEKFHGLTDIETRYRQRYLDLMMSPESRAVFQKRSQIINTLRQLMMEADYLEVETPMMHPIPGGATARPFTTHHNALDRDLFLRVAPELYLKRLVVGGFERVFEINRNFRNEGISPRHNPEFTMMEFYIAYRDYQYMMDFVEQLVRDTAKQVFATMHFTWNEDDINLERPFARFTLAEAMHHYHPEWSMENLVDYDFLAHQLSLCGVENIPTSLGERQLMLYEESTEAQTIQPTFILDYPIEVSPLARASDVNPSITERFELFIGGREIANGFSELNDPEDQAERFLAQLDKKNAGDHEAMYYDTDYITALEYGLPPTAGCGIGIDRLVMMLTNASNIRDVILFPTLKRVSTS